VQLTYVFSELGNGLKRNVSATVAVIVTIAVSMTLVGMGLLLNSQAHKAEKSWGNKLQITAFLCTDVSDAPTCVNGKVSADQKSQIEKTIESNSEVKAYHFEDSNTAFDKYKSIYEHGDSAQAQVLSAMRASDFPESYWITLKDPKKYTGIESALIGLQGVGRVQDLRQVLKPVYTAIDVFKYGALGIAAFLVLAALLQVANTIRLAAFARRREIGIMRLVGASTWYVQLPFVLEALFAAVVGVAIACGLIALVIGIGVDHFLVNSHLVDWVGWSDAVRAMLIIAAGGVALTVVPTLILSRRYLNV
jgi:cell division transport system permease protein